MKYECGYDHHNGEAEWTRRDLFDWVTDVFEAPHIVIGAGATTNIRNHVRDELTSAGWSGEVPLCAESDITVFSMKGDLAFQLQTGNASRAPYDLLKLQYLYEEKRIEAAALALPVRFAAKIIGENIASFERIEKELSIFDRIITVPILLIGFS